MSDTNQNVPAAQIWLFFILIFFLICLALCFTQLCTLAIKELQTAWTILFSFLMTIVIYLVWWFCIYYPVKNKSEVDSPNLKETYTKNDHFESENDMKDIMDEDKEMDEEIDNEINKETNNKMNVLPIIDSNKNDNLGIDNYFEVTPAKFCYNGGGGYVKPPTHSQQEYCQKLMSTEGGRNVYYTYSCQPGLFSGRPLNMPARTEESNSCWQNPIKLEGINGLPPLIPEHPPVL